MQLFHLFLRLYSHLSSKMPPPNHSHPLHQKYHHKHQWNHTNMPPHIKSYQLQSTADCHQSSQDIHSQPYGIYLSWGFVQGKQNKWDTEHSLHLWVLNTMSLRGKAINNIHCLSLFHYCHMSTQIWHGNIIRSLVVPKIWCLYHINIWHNLLDPVIKIQTMMS